MCSVKTKPVNVKGHVAKQTTVVLATSFSFNLPENVSLRQYSNWMATWMKRNKRKWDLKSNKQTKQKNRIFPTEVEAMNFQLPVVYAMLSEFISLLISLLALLSLQYHGHMSH